MQHIAENSAALFTSAVLHRTLAFLIRAAAVRDFASARQLSVTQSVSEAMKRQTSLSNIAIIVLNLLGIRNAKEIASLLCQFSKGGDWRKENAKERPPLFYKFPRLWDNRCNLWYSVW